MSPPVPLVSARQRWVVLEFESPSDADRFDAIVTEHGIHHALLDAVVLAERIDTQP